MPGNPIHGLTRDVAEAIRRAVAKRDAQERAGLFTVLIVVLMLLYFGLLTVLFPPR